MNAVQPIDEAKLDGNFGQHLEITPQNSAHGAMYWCRRNNTFPGLVHYTGYLKVPVPTPWDTQAYVAAVFIQQQDDSGFQALRIKKLAFLDTLREARETALLWQCKFQGIDGDEFLPGYFYPDEKKCLMVQLGASARLITITGPFITVQI